MRGNLGRNRNAFLRYAYMDKKKMGGGRSKKRIICNETKELFQSMSEASKQNGVSVSAISQHIKGNEKCKSIRGLTFRLVE